MDALKGVADELLATWRPDGATEAEVQDMNKLALSILACGYLCHVYTDTRRPVFMPLWNFACNQGGPDPDYIYLSRGDRRRRYVRDHWPPRHESLRRNHPGSPGDDAQPEGGRAQQAVPGDHPRSRRPHDRRRRLASA